MCDALVLTGLDTSTSIDEDELRVELDGISSALRSPSLLQMIQRGQHGCIAVSVFLWASDKPVIVLDWTIIGNEQQANAAADAVKASIESQPSLPAGILTDTASAMKFGYAMFGRPPVMTSRQILNVVTDDAPNQNAADVLPARNALLAAGAQINGVAIGADPLVMDFLRSQVIGGRGAFVMPIAQTDGMAAAMLSKFQLDLSMVTQ
jgi:Ca-activated chloride channel family protein